MSDNEDRNKGVGNTPRGLFFDDFNLGMELESPAGPSQLPTLPSLLI